MFSLVTQNTRSAVSAIAAVAIVSFSALTLDQAHIASAPRGNVEIGELTPVHSAHNVTATLPEVVVVAKREQSAPPMLASLPEIVVIAERQITLAGQPSGTNAASLARKAAVTGASVLLK